MKKENEDYPHPLIGQKVIVRAYNAGVHMGTLERADSSWVVLKDSHRCWQFNGVFTLSEVSQHGLSGGQIACHVDTMTIPTSDIGEVMNVTDKAYESILEHRKDPSLD